MKMTSSTESLQSMELQKDHHIRQTEIVRLRQRQAEMRNQSVKGMDVSGRWSKDFPHGVPSEDLLDVVDMNTETGAALRTIQECDSLLAFLNNRHSLDYKSYEQARSMKPPSAQTPLAKRHIGPKDSAQIIEELRIHNDALRRHILDCLHDQDALEAELAHARDQNARLRERVRQLEGKDMDESEAGNTNISSNPSRRQMMTQSMEADLEYEPATLRMNLDDLASMDLPPLEMPKFDMDALTLTSSQSDDEATNSGPTE